MLRIEWWDISDLTTHWTEEPRGKAEVAFVSAALGSLVSVVSGQCVTQRGSLGRGV